VRMMRIFYRIMRIISRQCFYQCV